MSEFKMSAEDRQILLAADELYYLDWRENDDDEHTAGWRHPGYFMEVNQPYDFSKLVEAGLMEKRETQGYVSYRITTLGAETAKALLSAQQPAAPPTGAAGAVDMYPSAFAQAVQGDDRLAVALYEAAVMTREAELMHKRVDELEAELSQTRGQLAACQGALRPFANQWAEWSKVENEWVHDPDNAMDIVEFFADYADNDVVASHLKAAYDALAAASQEGAG